MSVLGLTTSALLSIIFYTLCSSGMLVVNKVAINFLPLPAFVYFVQMIATVLCVASCKAMGLLKADSLCFERVQKFAPYATSFVMSIYCNGKVLQYSNVETIITFKACAPLCVCVLDWLLLGRELPSRRSLMSLTGVLAGAVGFVLCDSEFKLHGWQAYSWVYLYVVCNVFEMTYGKILLGSVKFDAAIWGSVWYTCSMASVPLLGVSIAVGEVRKLPDMQVPVHGMVALFLSTVGGVGISWAGWNCRSQTSATTYSLVGVACKLLSVLLNIAIWDKHATPMGIMWLVICLLSSSFYQQSPLRGKSEEGAPAKYIDT